MRAIVITLLVAILIIFVARNLSYRKTEPVIITHTDTVYQQKTFTKYTKGESIPFVVLSHDTLRDTAYIVKDYNTTKIYTDTFSLDSSKFTIIDTISKNMIQGRGFLADIHERTIRITNDIYHPSKNELYLGVLGDLRRFDNKLGIGVGLGFKTAKNALFTFGATTNQFSIGYYAKF
jgi:hypothetical protein